MFATALGITAAALTAASYLPQLMKAWRTGEANDLSLRMLLILFAGLTLWISYGYVQGDPVIIIANSVSAVQLLAILLLKARHTR